MANKYEIDITAKGRMTGSSGRPTPAELRRQTEQANDFQKNNRGKQNELNLLVDSNKQLIESMKELQRTIRDTSHGSHFGGGGRGVSSRGGVSVVANIPVIDMALGAVQWIADKLKQTGEAFIQSASEQLHTAGIGGFSKSTGSNYFSIADETAFRKARRMVTGSYGTGIGENLTSENINKTHAYSRLFGLGVEEIGHQVGVFDWATGNGGKTFGKILDIASRGGIETGLPQVMQEISSTLEEIISHGVSDSSLATDMAEQVAQAYQFTNNRSTKAALQFIKKGQTVQDEVAQGQYANTKSIVMHQAAFEIIQEELKSGKNIITDDGSKKYGTNLQRALDARIINEQMIQSGLTIEDIEGIAAFSNSQRDGAIQQHYNRSMSELISGKDSSWADTLFTARGTGLTDISEIMMYYNMSHDYKNSASSVGSEFDIKRGATGSHLVAQDRANKLQQLTLSETAEMASQSLIIFANSMNKVCQAVDDDLAKTIGGLNDKLIESARTLEKVYREGQELWGYIKTSPLANFMGFSKSGITKGAGSIGAFFSDTIGK